MRRVLCGTAIQLQARDIIAWRQEVHPVLLLLPGVLVEPAHMPVIGQPTADVVVGCDMSGQVTAWAGLNDSGGIPCSTVAISGKAS